MDTTSQIHIVEMIITIVVSVISSSGFWIFVMKRSEVRDCSKKLLLGLAHDRIVYLAMCYIDRGSLSQDEYENLYQFLYQPYFEMGGNGTAKRLIDEVNKLPIVNKKRSHDVSTG